MTAAAEALVRCDWVPTDDSADGILYRDYHDREWGRPLHGTAALFERVSLEAFQSGLSWLIILRKRDNFRRAFDGFDIATVAGYADADADRPQPGQDRGHHRQRPGRRRSGHRFRRPALVVRAATAPAAGSPVRRPGGDPGVDGHGAGAQTPRLQLRRPHHGLRVDAGHRNGRRSRRELRCLPS